MISARGLGGPVDRAAEHVQFVGWLEATPGWPRSRPRRRCTRSCPSPVASPGGLTFTVATELEHGVLARATVPAGAIGKDHTTLVELAFVVDRTREAVELPIASAGGARVSFDDVVLDQR